MLPSFKRYEAYEGGETEYRGASGELGVSDLRNDHRYCEAWVDAAVQLGLPRNRDFNAASTYGVGAYQLSLRHGWRSSAATAFLRPALRRGNVAVATGAQVTRVLFDGSTATGVEWLQGGAMQRAVASREVILCAGADPVTADPAAFRHRPGHAARDAWDRRGRGLARRGGEPPGSLPGPHDRPPEASGLVERRRAQPGQARGNGAAVAVPEQRTAYRRRRAGGRRRLHRVRAWAGAPTCSSTSCRCPSTSPAIPSTATPASPRQPGSAIRARAGGCRSARPIPRRRRASRPTTSPRRSIARPSSQASGCCGRSMPSPRFAICGTARCCRETSGGSDADLLDVRAALRRNGVSLRGNLPDGQ